MEKKLTKLNIEEMYEIEGGAMVSCLQNVIGGGAGNPDSNSEKPTSALLKPMGTGC